MQLAGSKLAMGQALAKTFVPKPFWADVIESAMVKSPIGSEATTRPWTKSERHRDDKDSLQRRKVMALTTEKETEDIGKTAGAANHDHDMIHDLSKRLDALWRYDQYITNAKNDQELSAFWSDVKRQDEANVRRLKELVKNHVKKDCF
jgi:hypothetical protein